MIIDRIRKEAKLQNIPVMREKTASLLAETIRNAKPQRILEIGTALGVSALISLINSSALLVTIDKDINMLEKAKKNIEEAGYLSRTEFILDDCIEAVRMMDGFFDFVILDGPKSNYLSLTQKLVHLMPHGGTIFADDVGYHGMVSGGYKGHKHRTIVTNMTEFNEYIRNHQNFKTEFFDIEDGVAIVKVNNEKNG